ncbi:hypothetical protein D3C76_1559490 [compost metagenome]
MLANFVHPLLHGVFRIQFTLGGFEARVTNQTGRTTHQRHRLMAHLLEAFQA